MNNHIEKGDLIVFGGRGWSSRFIQAVTFSRYSHIGIVGDDNLLFESTTGALPPCEIMKQKIKGSQAQLLHSRIAAYNGKVWRLPLVDSFHENSCSMRRGRNLAKYLVSLVGRPYDYIGAERSGGFLWNRIMRVLHPESLDALFCSELCAAALDHIGYFHTGSASSWSPGKLARALRRRGVVGKAIRIK